MGCGASKEGTTEKDAKHDAKEVKQESKEVKRDIKQDVKSEVKQEEPKKDEVKHEAKKEEAKYEVKKEEAKHEVKKEEAKHEDKKEEAKHEDKKEAADLPPPVPAPVAQAQAPASAPTPAAEQSAAPAPAPTPAAAPTANANAAAAPTPAVTVPDTKTKDDRKRVWAELQKRLPRTKSADDKARRIELWKSVDENATGRVSIQEVDAACRSLLHLDEFTSNLNAIIIRAFEKANNKGGKRGSGEFVEFLEFRLLICYIYDYFELQTMFDDVDSSDDGRISVEEFKKAIPLIEKWGLNLADPEAAFNEVDKDKSGVIFFSEFAQWASEKKLDADGDPDNES